MARNRAANASVFSHLDQARKEAEMLYDNGRNGYEGICSGTTFNNLIVQASTVAGHSNTTPTVALTTAGNTVRSTCHANASGFAVAVPLVGGGYACIDSAGRLGTREFVSGVSLAANALTCP